MSHYLVPMRDLAFQVFLVRVRQRTELEEEFVAVGRFMVEAQIAELLRRLRSRFAEVGDEVEAMRQLERAVVMPVIADEPIADRRLRRTGFQRRMGIDHAGRGIE